MSAGAPLVVARAGGTPGAPSAAPAARDGDPRPVAGHDGQASVPAGPRRQ